MIIAIKPYIDLMRLHKPIGILLLLWPTLQAMWLATDGRPNILILLVFTAGVVIMRSAGCVINDIADRNFDKHVKRTKERPLAQRLISVRQALICFCILLALAFGLVCLLSLKVIFLSVIAAALAMIYPFAKRFTNYPQIILGTAFACSIPMAYMQQLDTIPFEGWLVFAITMAWVIAYDTIYAMADKVDDLKIGIKSTAIAFGRQDKVFIFILHCIYLSGFLGIGYLRGVGALFYVCILLALMLCIYQQTLIKNREPMQCLLAFLNNNYIGAIVLIGLILGM